MPIEDILGLGKVSEKLLDVISKGIGTAWNPIQIRLEASSRAYEIKKITEAVNSVNDAQKSIEYNNGKLIVTSDKGFIPEVYESLSTRITDRTMYQESKKQLNIENTIYYAQQDLNSAETISNEPLDEDWITRFFKIIEDISSNQMQHLWGRILAGEVKQPNSFSLRTLEVLRNMSSTEAKIFHKFSQYAIVNGSQCYVIQDEKYLESVDIDFQDFLILSDAGLLSSSTTISMHFERVNNDNVDDEILILGDTAIILKRKEGAPLFAFNIYSFTTVGKELLQLIDIASNENYINYIIKKCRGMEKTDIYRADIVSKNTKVSYENLIKQ